MNDTNFIAGIVKVLETPRQKIIKKNILVTTFRVQFPQVRKNSIVSLKIWGDLGHDVGTYYKINDYILIEGYLAIKTKKNKKLQQKKKIEITISKIYPFLLN